MAITVMVTTVAAIRETDRVVIRTVKAVDLQEPRQDKATRTEIRMETDRVDSRTAMDRVVAIRETDRVDSRTEMDRAEDLTAVQDLVAATRVDSAWVAVQALQFHR